MKNVCKALAKAKGQPPPSESPDVHTMPVVDGGHFALDTAADEIAALVGRFVAS